MTTAITRSFTLLYTLSLLTIFTRIQLNLLGRRNYLSSVISLATPPTNSSSIRLEDNDDDLTQTLGDDFETNRRYLAFSWWLLHRGWRELMDQVRVAVSEVFGPLNPREDITLTKLSECTLRIRKIVEGSTELERRYVYNISILYYNGMLLRFLTTNRSRRWLSYLLPPREEEDKVLQKSGVLGASEPASPQTATKLRHLLDETADLIESPSFSYVVTLLNNEGFATLVENRCAADAFKSTKPEPEPEPESLLDLSAPPAERSTKLASVLAVMARQAHVIGNGGNPPNDYLVAMEQGVRELDAFAAVVYSSNFDNELLSSGMASRLPTDDSPPEADPSDADADADAGQEDPSYSTVMVDKDDTTGGDEYSVPPNMVQSIATTTDLPMPSSTTTPVETTEKKGETDAKGEGETEQAGHGVSEDSSALERAWGKAVDDGNGNEKKEEKTQ